MASDYIGIVYDTVTKQVYLVIDHPDDALLDDPAHLDVQTENGHPVALLKLPRAQRFTAANVDQVVAAAIAALEAGG